MFNWVKSRIQNWLDIIPAHRIEAMSECISAIDKFLEEKDLVTAEDVDRHLDAEGFLKEDDIENTVHDCLNESYIISDIEISVKNIESSMEGVESDISEKEDEIENLKERIIKLEKALLGIVALKTLSGKTGPP